MREIHRYLGPKTSAVNLIPSLRTRATEAELETWAQVWERDSAVPAHHKTSPSTLESIGRWRQDLTAHDLDVIGTKFDRFKSQFGYE